MSNGSNIPEARRRLEWICDGLDNGLIAPESASAMVRDKVLALMTRAYSRKRSERVSDPILSTTIEEVQTYVDANPDEALHKVAERFNLNPGRISEILSGKRSA